jgi:hypothetical protein
MEVNGNRIEFEKPVKEIIISNAVIASVHIDRLNRVWIRVR